MLAWNSQGGPQGNPKLQSRYNRYWQELGALPDNEFEDYAETFEDAIWYGSDKLNPQTRDKLFSKNIKKGKRINLEDVLKHRTPDQYPPIDITITYGDMSKSAANHTVRKLLDVEFVGQGQSIEVDDTIFESFHFLARNLV